MAIPSHHSLPVRVTALGFIFTILFGNLWLVYLIFNSELPRWIGYGFYIGVLLALTGGLATLVNFVAGKIEQGRSLGSDDSSDGEP